MLKALPGPSPCEVCVQEALAGHAGANIRPAPGVLYAPPPTRRPSPRLRVTMSLFSLGLTVFAAVLLLLAGAAARDLRHLDDILEVVEVDAPPSPEARG